MRRDHQRSPSGFETTSGRARDDPDDDIADDDDDDDDVDVDVDDDDDDDDDETERVSWVVRNRADEEDAVLDPPEMYEREEGEGPDA